MATKRPTKPQAKKPHITTESFLADVAKRFDVVTLPGVAPPRAVYQLLAEGKTEAQIAGHLGCSLEDVRSAVQSAEFEDVSAQANASRRALLQMRALDVIEQAVQDGDVATARWVSERLDPHFAADAKTRREARSAKVEKSIEAEAEAIEAEIEAMDENELVRLAKRFK